MLDLQETKEFLRVDGDEEDALISSLIVTAKDLTEDVMRRKLSDFKELPEPVRQAMLILVATLYEERQVSKGKTACRSPTRSTLSGECCLLIGKERSDGHR